MYRSLLMVAGVAGVAGAQSQTPEQTLQHAIEMHRAGNVDGAIPGYRAFLKVHPEVGPIHSNLGAALAAAGRYEEAIAEYRKALAKDARNPQIRLNLALAYYKTAQVATAAEELSAVLKMEPANHQALILLADCNLQMGDNKRVIELLTPVEPQAPEDRALVYLLGTALIRDQQTERGQVLIERILRDGDSAEVRLLLGTTKYYAHDSTGALDDLKKALELNPKLPDANAYYGLLLLSTGDETGAEGAFRNELAANPNSFTANLELGVVLKQADKNDEARGFFERALLVRPGDAAVRYQLATLDLAAGNLERARQTLEHLIEEAPQFTEAHVSLATIYYRLKRKAEGDKQRLIVLKLNSDRQAQQPGVEVK